MTSPPIVPVAFASCSIGLGRHTLHQKIEAISQAGFTAIEISMPDLIAYARTLFNRRVREDEYDALAEAGRGVRQLAEHHKLKILVLQPFANFEGWKVGSREHKKAFDRARGWMDIMSALGTDMLQVGSSDTPGITASMDDLASDLASLADLMASRQFKIAYENWCWATRAPTWREIWEIVQRAGRPNIGLCLDTFQCAGGEWADPTTKSGLIEGVEEAELTKKFETSMEEMGRTIPKEKIYFLQISDAYRANPPLSKDTDRGGLRPRGRWSHDSRPLPYDGGYLPLGPCVQAVLKTGFRGYFSIEVFDGKFDEKYGDDLGGFAKKAREANERLVEEATKST